jgi:hypothetical protein
MISWILPDMTVSSAKKSVCLCRERITSVVNREIVLLKHEEQFIFTSLQVGIKESMKSCESFLEGIIKQRMHKGFVFIEERLLNLIFLGRNNWFRLAFLVE